MTERRSILKALLLAPAAPAVLPALLEAAKASQPRGVRTAQALVGGEWKPIYYARIGSDGQWGPWKKVEGRVVKFEQGEAPKPGEYYTIQTRAVDPSPGPSVWVAGGRSKVRFRRS